VHHIDSNLNDDHLANAACNCEGFEENMFMRWPEERNILEPAVKVGMIP
jgi:hypothetical protein